jgi:hypothetical protein
VVHECGRPSAVTVMLGGCHGGRALADLGGLLAEMARTGEAVVVDGLATRVQLGRRLHRVPA